MYFKNYLGTWFINDNKLNEFLLCGSEYKKVPAEGVDPSTLRL